MAIADWRDTTGGRMRATADSWSGGAAGLDVGQRFHRVGLPSVIWRVVRVYRDSQGLAHAILASNRRDLDAKTLSATVLLDQRWYRPV